MDTCDIKQQAEAKRLIPYMEAYCDGHVKKVDAVQAPIAKEEAQRYLKEYDQLLKKHLSTGYYGGICEESICEEGCWKRATI